MEVFLLKIFQKIDSRITQELLAGVLLLGIGFTHIPGNSTDTIHPNGELRFCSSFSDEVTHIFYSH